MTTYSSFFSSGLLAAHHTVYNHLSNRIDHGSSVSPTTLIVGDALDDASDVEIDRSVTPTPMPPMKVVQPGPASGSQGFSGQPKLRRRRSSLTMATSPMNVIKSPTRSAGNAIQFQRHFYTSPGRSRSGSASSVTSIGEEVLPASSTSNAASKGNSLLGRLRSGSVGSVLKSRRGVRRVPGPSHPPPSVPLPPLPALPTIPGTPNRSKAKSFSIQIPSGTSQALAHKLAAAGGSEGNNFMLQMNHYVPASPTLMSPRQPLGELHLRGRDQDVLMHD